VDTDTELGEPGVDEFQAAGLMAYALGTLEKLAESGASLHVLKQAISREINELDGTAGFLIEVAREVTDPSASGTSPAPETRRRGHLWLVPK
jgi:hypothetical protein